ncbi:V-type ATPase subunit [Candidatus Woesearchaeota archaeon]|nr:V-type ATPase subunit [Candidatus Woesearchaeota archaeon]
MIREDIALEESPYASVRVAVMRTLLIPKKDYQKLMNMSLAEISNYLGETQYRKEINELAPSFSGIELIEKALNRNYSTTIGKLKKISPEPYRDVINAYLLRNDSENIKTIIRGIIGKIPGAKIKEMLLPDGMLKAEKLAEKNSVEDLLEALTAPFKGMAKNDIFSMENETDHRYFRYAISLADRMPEHGMLFKEFLLGLIEITNVLAFLRLWRNKEKDIGRHIFYTRRPLVKKLISASSKEEISKILSESEYGLKLEDSLIPIEVALSRHIFRKTLVFQHQEPLSVYVVLGYLFAKEIEIRNVRRIIQAKHLGMEMRAVEEQIIA